MRRWSTEEEEALRRAVTRFGSVSCWKEIKENEPALANRSLLQLSGSAFLVAGKASKGVMMWYFTKGMDSGMESLLFDNNMRRTRRIRHSGVIEYERWRGALTRRFLLFG